uniref:Interleukin-1 n=1 Tax=Sciurus vulgaris TaxID=55149 RepID=A0A8D2CND4_SCIVU
SADVIDFFQVFSESLFTAVNSCSVVIFPSSKKSFYAASYDPLGETCVDKLMSLGTSESSRTAKLTFKQSLVLVSANGKTLKKRRLSFNQPISDDDLEAIAYDVEARSAPHVFQSSGSYTYRRVIKEEFFLNDTLHQSIIQDPTSQYLKATSLNDQDREGNSRGFQISVTLRISKTRLFVSAQEEGNPVLLREMPETPKTIKEGENDLNLIFFWERHGNMNYFTSAAHPELLIATKVDSLVHMARGPPRRTDFQDVVKPASAVGCAPL